MYLWKKPSTFSLYNTHRLVFLIEEANVYCAVRPGSLNKIDYFPSQMVKCVCPYAVHLNYCLELQENCAFSLNKIKEQSSGPDRHRSAYWIAFLGRGRVFLEENQYLSFRFLRFTAVSFLTQPYAWKKTSVSWISWSYKTRKIASLQILYSFM